MQQSRESFLSTILSLLTRKSSDLFQYCQKSAEPHITKAIQKTEPYYNKSKEFYHQHEKVILIALTATVVYLVFGSDKKKEEDKPKKKKQIANKMQAATKVFASDDSGEQYKEEPSTSIRVESSGKQAASKKRVGERVLQRIQSSSEQQETGDKIFFEMYKQYQDS